MKSEYATEACGMEVTLADRIAIIEKSHAVLAERDAALRDRASRIEAIIDDLSQEKHHLENHLSDIEDRLRSLRTMPQPTANVSRLR